MTNGMDSPRMTEIPENNSTDEAVKPTKTLELPSSIAVYTPSENETATKELVKPKETLVEKLVESHESPDEADDLGDDMEAMEEPVIQQIHHAQPPQVITRARLVTVVKPTPPKLPPRNPIRERRDPLSIDLTHDQGTGTSSFSSSGRPSPSSLHDRSSVRSSDSISSTDGLEAVAERFKVKPEPSAEKAVAPAEDEKGELHSVPDSPTKRHIPGGFS